MEAPKSFAKYVESVQVSNSSISNLTSASLKPYRINNCEHFVFEMDISQLQQIVSEHTKFDFGMF